MAGNIDARDDFRAQLQLSSNIGQGIGSAVGGYFGMKENERRRNFVEMGLVRILNDPNLTDSQKRLEILQLPHAMQFEFAKQTANTLPTAYQQNAMDYRANAASEQDQAYKRLRNYRQAATIRKTLEEARLTRLAKDPNADTSDLDRQIQGVNSEMQGFLLPIAPEKSDLQTDVLVPHTPEGFVGQGLQHSDYQQGPAVTRQPPVVAQTPEPTQPPKSDVAADVMAGTAFTGEPPAGQMAKWKSMTPEQRVAYLTGKTPKADAELAKVVAASDFEPYMEKLDPESKIQLEKILAGGNPETIQKALERLRQTYGAL